MKTLTDLEREIERNELALNIELKDSNIDMSLVWLLKMHIHSLYGLVMIQKGINIDPDNLRIIKLLKRGYTNCSKKETYEDTKRITNSFPYGK